MEVLVKGDIISIHMKDLNSESLSQFVKDYSSIFPSFEKEKNKKLYFIEERDFKVENKRFILGLTLVLYKNFKKLHETYVSNIEFIFASKMYYKLFKSVSALYPLKHPYTVKLKEEEVGEFLGK